MKLERVCVAFGYPRNGWVQMAVMADASNATTVLCSDVYPPFSALLAWLHCLVEGNLPAEFTIDEESGLVTLRAQASPLGQHAVEFTLVEHDGSAPLGATDLGSKAETVLRCHTDRVALAAEFARRLQRWLNEDYDRNEFGCGGIDDFVEEGLDHPTDNDDTLMDGQGQGVGFGFGLGFGIGHSDRRRGDLRRLDLASLLAKLPPLFPTTEVANAPQ